MPLEAFEDCAVILRDVETCESRDTSREDDLALSMRVRDFLGTAEALLAEQLKEQAGFQSQRTELVNAAPARIERAAARSIEALDRMGGITDHAEQLRGILSGYDRDAEPLARKITPQAKKLLRLHRQKCYLDLVDQVETYSTAARRAIEEDNEKDASAAATESLHKLVGLIPRARGDFDGGGNLDKMLCARIKYLVDTLRQRLSKALRQSLELLQWPRVGGSGLITSKQSTLETFSHSFIALSRMQTFCATREKEWVGEGSDDEEASQHGRTDLWAMEMLVLPLVQRFAYHFDGSRETAAIDKPEWYMANVLEVKVVNRTCGRGGVWERVCSMQ
jgi:hypothetical protein